MAVSTPRQAAPYEQPDQYEREERRGSGWMVLVVVFAAFLCTLGSIPIGILAYSSGALERFAPGLVARASPTPTLAATTATRASTPTATLSPTSTLTPTPMPTPTATPVPMAVPRLVGVPFPAARQQAQAAGLEVSIAGEVHSSQYPQTYVVSQKPEAGTAVQKGARIEVVVSLGKEFVAVPRVVGDTAPVAEGKLQAAGFGWSLIEEFNEQVPAGVVLAQNPAPEVKAEKGVEVVLTVSAGTRKVAVPALIGMPEVQAQDTIVKAGLSKYAPNYQDYTTVPPGHVISQQPGPGVLVERGTTVYIAVRKPQPTAAPTTAPPPPPKKRD